MLVLSRRVSEKIVFPSLNITVQLLQVKGRMARLGIEAPSDVPIIRQEFVTRDGCKGSSAEWTLSERNDGECNP